LKNKLVCALLNSVWHYNSDRTVWLTQQLCQSARWQNNSQVLEIRLNILSQLLIKQYLKVNSHGLYIEEIHYLFMLLYQVHLKFTVLTSKWTSFNPLPKFIIICVWGFLLIKSMIHHVLQIHNAAATNISLVVTSSVYHRNYISIGLIGILLTILLGNIVIIFTWMTKGMKSVFVGWQFFPW